MLSSRCNGLQIGNLRIVENGDSGSDIAPSDHLPLIDRAAIWMGGGAAQQHFQAPSTDRALIADYASILSLTPDMTNEHREEMIELAFVRARDIIAMNADEVRRLAKLLIAARCVNLSDVRPPIVARYSAALAPRNARRA